MNTDITSPFHRGEQAIQERVGVRQQVEKVGRRFIRDHLPEEHRQFFGELPFLLVGSVDGSGRPWASILCGAPGFISSPEPRMLHIDTAPLPSDPAAGNLVPGAHVGILGIELHSRRRNRMNGRVVEGVPGTVSVRVDQSFGNCPMYIQARDYRSVPPSASPAAMQTFSSLTPEVRALIERSDSFFIASQFLTGEGHASDGVDVSHRGGRPGFVRIDDEGTLTFPDFTGNTHFNTLGNISLNPTTGLLFVDFENGDLVQLTGSAEIVWEGEELEAFVGAERLLRFRLDEGRRLPEILPLRWSFEDYSPVLEQTGSWKQVAAALAAKERQGPLREYRVRQVVRESDGINSYYLEAADGEPPPEHTAGQFLPMQLDLAKDGPTLRRTYTISSAPDGRSLRLSIKREPPPSPAMPAGQSSSHFHDHVAVGSRLRAMAPRGCFTLDRNSGRPVVLLSAGVGVTPMISMLEQLNRDRENCRQRRPVWFIHAARSGAEHAFGDHVRRLTAHPEMVTHVAYSAPRDDDMRGRDFDSEGRIDAALLRTLLPLDDYDFYLCGPGAFMQSMFGNLRALGVDHARIHYEFFGPASRLGDSDRTEPAEAEAGAREPVAVVFRKSGVETLWQPGTGTLLDLAESEGLAPPYSCRSGVCQTCATAVQGAVEYLQPPMADPPPGEVLICCAVPAESESGTSLSVDL